MDYEPHFNGPEYDPLFDFGRLSNQLARVKGVMRDEGWRTLSEISGITGDPPSSVSAQLRHLRKERFGSYIVDRRSRDDRTHGLFEYRVRPPGSGESEWEVEIEE